ncbi:MAG: damage-inducible protein D [Ignavibacteria bacterium]|nr:damage-inducible protein D [Ignavibacteria bacterium]
MTAKEIFNPETNDFEELSKVNGFKYWFARDIMVSLGYDDYRKFLKAIERAISTCISLQITVDENFISIEREINSVTLKDYKLSRFACYLTAMNGDTKKPEVAKAQAFFIKQTEIVEQYIKNVYHLDRLITRDEIKNKEISLSGVVNRAGIECYPLFQNAGYRGLYNMNLNELKNLRKIDKRESLLDYMGKTELAANLFRITQTEEKIKNENINGQRNLENAAEVVGQKVRKTIIEISGTRPEYLPKEQNIKIIKKGLKSINKRFKKIDKKQK